MELAPYLWLFPVGVLVGTIGTMVGAGGGFLLVPILMMAYPTESPDTITSISMATVFFNALSGSIAYARKGRIDYRSALTFAAAALPGAIIGAYFTTLVPRQTFSVVFGLLLLAFSARLLLARPRARSGQNAASPAGWSRVIVERDGTEHRYAFRPSIGIAISAVVGFVSSALGVGGGIIHVPAMVGLLSFPVHIATATSHLTLAITSLAATAAHITTGAFAAGALRIVPLAAGVLLGAPLGARFSDRVKGTWILRGLALALAAVGFRILLTALIPV